MNITEYISLEILAAKLKLPQNYLRNLAESHQIPTLNVGSRLRFNPEAVQQALNKIAASQEAEGHHDD